MQRSRYLLVLCAICLTSASAVAQQPPPPKPTFQSAVTLVTSDVVVRDRRGQFHANLAKEHFELYEDGVKQELTSFVARPRRSPAATQAG